MPSQPHALKQISECQMNQFTEMEKKIKKSPTKKDSIDQIM